MYLGRSIQCLFLHTVTIVSLRVNCHLLKKDTSVTGLRLALTYS